MTVWFATTASLIFVWMASPVFDSYTSLGKCITVILYGLIVLAGMFYDEYRHKKDQERISNLEIELDKIKLEAKVMQKHINYLNTWMGDLTKK
jgi:hypothetical protein